MVITSGASPAATEVASLSKYPEMSPGSALMVTSGFFSRNRSITCSVVAARSVLPHQAKRREEESPSAWPPPVTLVPQAAREVLRSEEHTSELQSRFDIVCRRLLAR